MQLRNRFFHFQENGIRGTIPWRKLKHGFKRTVVLVFLQIHKKDQRLRQLLMTVKRLLSILMADAAGIPGRADIGLLY